MFDVQDSFISPYSRSKIVACVKEVLPHLGVQIDDETTYTWSHKIGCQILHVKTKVVDVHVAVTEYGVHTIGARDLRENILDEEEFVQRVRMAAYHNGEVEGFCRAKKGRKAMNEWLDDMLDPLHKSGIWSITPLKQSITIEEWARLFMQKYEWKGEWQAIDCLRKAFSNCLDNDSWMAYWEPKMNTGKAFMLGFDLDRCCTIPQYDPEKAPRDWIYFVIPEGTDAVFTVDTDKVYGHAY